jgi:hypothetical protein
LYIGPAGHSPDSRGEGIVGRRHALPDGLMSQLEMWIGLVELKPLDRRKFDFAGAFTNIITCADSPEAFRRKATAMETLNMFVADVQNAESLAKRTENSTLTEEVEDMQHRAEFNPNAIIYGNFHTYPFDEA